MRRIVEALNKINGQVADIFIEHRIFGKQHVTVIFKPETEIGLGFHCKEQIIYIDKTDLIDYEISDTSVVINGNMMKLKIVI